MRQRSQSSARVAYAEPPGRRYESGVSPLLLAVALAWELRDPDDRPTGRSVDAAALFPTATLPSGATVRTDPAAIGAVAASTLAWLRAVPDDPASDPGLFVELGLDRARAEATLQLVVDTARAEPERLSDPAWIAAHFELRRWLPDPGDTRTSRGNLGRQLRLTRYLTPQVEGAATPDATHDQALWADPGPGLRERYTRREVMEGAYLTGPDAGRATPLCWLTETAVHDALMQGSVSVRLPDGTTTVYGVDVPNGRPYRPDRRGRDQDRFWYFRALPEGPKGYGPPGTPAIPLRAGAAVAGDVLDLGLGRLLLLAHPGPDGAPVVRLAVLADTGGAFQPNLTQLDWYGGAFADHAGLYAAWRELPDRVDVYVLWAR